MQAPGALRSAALAAACVIFAACPPSSTSTDAKKRSALEPEHRFGNDPELVADFAALKTCVYRDGRLDDSCDKLQVLRRRLLVKSRKRERRPKVVTTLANLLESRRELTRLVAAESLFPHHAAPAIVAATRRALAVEKAPAVKAALLRQSCWRPTDWARRVALELLDPAESPRVQAEAATCLGRIARSSEGKEHRVPIVRALVSALDRTRTAAVRARACAALGAAGAAEATAALAALLDEPDLAGRCAPAVARLGTRDAYEALLGAARQGLAASRTLPTQLVSALTAFEGRPFVDREGLAQVLQEIAGQRAQSWVARCRAVEALTRLDSRAHLDQLRRAYAAGERSEDDERVLKALEVRPPRPSR